MKKKFDYLNLFYGVGAAIVLLAVLFKFLGWKYANEIFMVGISAEVLVFLVSGFSWKRDDREYEWDRVFPQLTYGEKGEQSTNGASEENLDRGSLISNAARAESLEGELKSLHETISNLNASSSSLLKTVKSTEHEYKNFSEVNQHYRQEVERLRDRLRAANESLQSLEKYK